MSDRPLEGVKIVLTGKLSTVRAEATAAIERLGGTVQSSVNYGTSFLVAGERVGSVKLNAARSRGVTVIDEDTLLRMIGL